MIAASTAAFGGYALEEALAGVAEAGLRWVEIACIDGYVMHVPDEQLTPGRAAQVVKALEANRLETWAFSAHMDLTADGAPDRFARRMRFAADIGARVVITNISRADVRSLFIERLRGLLPLAEELDVTIAIEGPGNYLPAAEEFRSLLRAVDSPRLRLNLDIGNIFTASFGRRPPVPELLPLAGDLVQLHVKDARVDGDVWRCVPVGEGGASCREALSALSGRSIPLCIEMPLSLEGKEGRAAYLTAPLPKRHIVDALRRSLAFVEAATRVA